MVAILRRDFLLGLGGGAFTLWVSGCTKPKPQVIETKPTAVNLSDLIHFRRDLNTGRIYAEPNRDTEKFLSGLKELGYSDQDKAQLNLWFRQFNRLITLPQNEIRVGELVPPPSLPEKIDVENSRELERFKIFNPKRIVTMSPYLPLSTDFENKNPKQPILASPGTTTFQARKAFPLLIDMSDANPRFIPGSVQLRHFVNVNAKDQIEKGIYFNIEFNDGRTDSVIVSQGNLPLTIDAGDKVHIIGLDKAGKIEAGIFNK